MWAMCYYSMTNTKSVKKENQITVVEKIKLAYRKNTHNEEK